MICSECGKDIPFAGQVCPYCHREKRADQNGQAPALVLGLAGAVLGYFIGEDWGVIVGLVVGAIVGFKIGDKESAQASAAQSTVSPSPTQSANSAAADALINYVNSLNVSVTGLAIAFDGATSTVTVRGVVPDAASREKIVLGCRSVEGVKSVIDLIAIAGPNLTPSSPTLTAVGPLPTAKSFYDLLEVSKTAGQETIQAAYDVLTRKYAASAQEENAYAARQLKMLRAAYGVLSDPQQRALYDHRLTATPPKQELPAPAMAAHYRRDGEPEAVAVSRTQSTSRTEQALSASLDRFPTTRQKWQVIAALATIFGALWFGIYRFLVVPNPPAAPLVTVREAPKRNDLSGWQVEADTNRRNIKRSTGDRVRACVSGQEPCLAGNLCDDLLKMKSSDVRSLLGPAETDRSIAGQHFTYYTVRIDEFGRSRAIRLQLGGSAQVDSCDYY